MSSSQKTTRSNRIVRLNRPIRIKNDFDWSRILNTRASLVRPFYCSVNNCRQSLSSTITMAFVKNGFHIYHFSDRSESKINYRIEKAKTGKRRLCQAETRTLAYTAYREHFTRTRYTNPEFVRKTLGEMMRDCRCPVVIDGKVGTLSGKKSRERFCSGKILVTSPKSSHFSPTFFPQ